MKLRHLLPVFIFIIMSLSACEQGAFLTNKQDNFILEFSYEEETITFNEAADKSGNPLEVDPVYAEPKIERNRIKIGIKSDGTGEMVVKSIEPHNKFKPAPPPLPGDEPVAQTIKYADGMVYYISAEGEILNSHPDEPMDFSVFLDYYNNHKLTPDYFTSTGNIQLKSTTEVSPIVGEYETMYEQVFTSGDDVGEDFIGKKSIVITDNETGLVKRSALLNEDETFSFWCKNEYDENGELPIPTFTKSHSYSEMSDGQLNIFITITINEDFNIIDNQ